MVVCVRIKVFHKTWKLFNQQAHWFFPFLWPTRLPRKHSSLLTWLLRSAHAISFRYRSLKKKKILDQKIFLKSEKNHWFQRYITTWVKHFWKWVKNIKICYFWPKSAVYAKNSIFWRFWPISKNVWPRLLYTVGISDFFPNFWDQKKSKKSIFF